MKKISVIISIFTMTYLIVGCEGSFVSSDETPDPVDQLLITLLEPPNSEQCLTQGIDGDGNWRVLFDWSVTPQFEGSFTIILTENGNVLPSQNISQGDVLPLSPNTLYTWQIQAEGIEEQSETFTFATPAPSGQPTSPPRMSTIDIEPFGNGHRISCTVIDDDLNEIRLFIDGNLNADVRSQSGLQEWVVNDLLSDSVNIRIEATDNSGHATEQSRSFSN